jgi:hypothetical protein
VLGLGIGLGLGLSLTACSGADTVTIPEPGPNPNPAERNPASLVVVTGSGQQVPALVPLKDSLVVQVRDGAGRPAADVGLTFRIVEGAGEVLTPSARTDANGQARALVIPAQGAVRVEALAPTAPTVSPAIFEVVGRMPASGTTHIGRAGYAEYRPGTLPVILSAPHGGGLEPGEIPVRSGGVQTRDLNTTDLTERMAAALEARFGARPHVVLFHLHRRMVDANREIREAAEGHPLGEHAWHEFQGMIAHAHARVVAEHGNGLYLDIHGHGHTIQRLELGYLHSAAALRQSDEELSTLASVSSLRALTARSGAPLAALVRGPTALGTLLAQGGFPSVPSAEDPAPLEGEPYFSGGYNTLRWGSRTAGTIDGIQIEANFTGVRDTAANRARFALVSAEAIETFLQTWYTGRP